MREFAAREIGARIAQARREAGGMTQETLAEALNISTRSVQDYEAGVTIPWKHFKRLEQIFKRDLTWFLYGTTAIQGERPASDEHLLERLEVVESLLQELLRRLPDVRPEPQASFEG